MFNFWNNPIITGNNINNLSHMFRIEAAGAGPEPVQPEIIDLTGDDD